MVVKGDNKYYQLRIKSSRNERYVYTYKFFAKNGWQVNHERFNSKRITAFMAEYIMDKNSPKLLS